ncbi:MAG TPA: S26 family signal peptidase [Candidatus Thermoplasmatota archaeon]|nr:S26 family signal peptidase [Candidatus Thermoplasmatota archaeon]
MQDDVGPGKRSGSDGPTDGPAGTPPVPRRGRFEENAPALHRFLHSPERRYVVARELATGVVVVLLVLSILWGFTGQPVGRSPIVVVESGSMMHCSNGYVPFGRDCDAPLARLGTIDPGDLILVKDIDEADDVGTRAGEGRSHYGRAGDVIVFRPDGLTPAQGRTPVIHRALFFLQVNEDGTFTIEELGLSHVDDLDDPRIEELGLGRGYAEAMRDARLDPLCGPVGPGRSGFVTRGDNNPAADQGTHSGIANCTVQTRWILGEARGEIPWLGLVKLYATDLPKGCPVLPYSTKGPIQPCNYHNAGGDTKVFLFLTVGALLGGPYLYERIRRARYGEAE